MEEDAIKLHMDKVSESQALVVGPLYKISQNVFRKP